VVDEALKFKRELLAFKDDFEKAYDYVDQKYADAVLATMNFPTLWCKWVLECITIATSSDLVNGSLIEEFKLERALCQGDPLSPLFPLKISLKNYVIMWIKSILMQFWPK